MKHTPGPWKVMSQRINGDVVTDQNNRNIMNRADFREQRSNALLIAAAPELLQTLKDCLSYLDQEQFGPDENAPFDGNIRMIICEAIAKAEGR